MGFNTRGSVQTTPPFTCSKNKNVPMGRFYFWNGLFVATLGLTQSCSLRSGTLTPTYRRSLISSLKSVINAFFNGQLVALFSQANSAF